MLLSIIYLLFEATLGAVIKNLRTEEKIKTIIFVSRKDTAIALWRLLLPYGRVDVYHANKEKNRVRF